MNKGLGQLLEMIRQSQALQPENQKSTASLLAADRPQARHLTNSGRVLTAAWSSPALMNGLGLRRACLGDHLSFRIRRAKDSPGPSGGVRDCRNLR